MPTASSQSSIAARTDARKQGVRFEPAAERWGAALAYSVAAVALGYAMRINFGSYHPRAVLWLTVALAFCLAGLLLPRIERLERLADRPLVWLLSAGFACQSWQLITTNANNRFPAPAFSALMSVAVLLFALSVPESQWLKRMQIPALLLLHFALGVWLIRSTPDPFIDVYLFHRQSLEALLHGINPYTLSIPNIYGHTDFYGAGVVVEGRVNVGFPYPPLSLWLALPGHLIGGDYRYSNLAAMTLAGAFMAYARRGRLGIMAASIFLFTPSVFHLLEYGWTDPLVVLFLAATVFCACRAPRFLPLSLGLLFAVKQYAVLAAPFVFFLLPPPFNLKDFARLIGKATLVAALLTLPLLLINIRAFTDDVLLFQLRQPFRLDSLSYPAWIAHRSGVLLPVWLGFIAFIAAAALTLRRAPRTPAGFAATLALTSLFFFAFSKQAFGNYYFFILGALCCAVAATANRNTSAQAG